MKILKYILITLVSVFALLAAGFYLYIQTLPTAPPDFINASEVDNQQAKVPFQCSQGKDFSYAYQVQIAVESKLNDQLVYQSAIAFKTQLQQSNDQVIQGLATDISIHEGRDKNSIADVHYITRAQATPSVLFSAYDDLALPEKHPMKILSQFVKALSVGAEHERYHFAYDSMQRTYQYQHDNDKVSRTSSITTANTQALTNTLQSFDDNWQVQMADDCLPQLLSSVERQGLVAAGHGGYIKFSINANRIANFIDLSSISLTDHSNAGNSWANQEIASSEFENEVTSQGEMWSVIEGFKNSKNTARLIKAADYLIDNLTADQLANELLAENLDDESKRDLAFALSLSNHPEAEAMILTTLEAIPGNQGNTADLQKVRLMVALSGNSQVSSEGYYGLANIARDTSESPNVRNNALINMASSVQQMEQSGQGDSGLSHDLNEQLSEEINDGNASAILAAGNAGLEDLNLQIESKLNSADSKERYAAATVLSRQAEFTDTVIQHLKNEPSDLVSNAILSNLKPEQLSSAQRNDLQNIANNASPDIAQIIYALIQ